MQIKGSYASWLSCSPSHRMAVSERWTTRACMCVMCVACVMGACMCVMCVMCVACVMGACMCVMYVAWVMGACMCVMCVMCVACVMRMVCKTHACCSLSNVVVHLAVCVYTLCVSTLCVSSECAHTVLCMSSHHPSILLSANCRPESLCVCIHCVCRVGTECRVCHV